MLGSSHSSFCITFFPSTVTYRHVYLFLNRLFLFLHSKIVVPFDLQLYCLSCFIAFSKDPQKFCPADFPSTPCGNHSPNLSVDLNLLSSLGWHKQNKKKQKFVALGYLYLSLALILCGSVLYPHALSSAAVRRIFISTRKVNFSVSVLGICSPIHVHCIPFPLFMPHFLAPIKSGSFTTKSLSVFALDTAISTCTFHHVRSVLCR